MKRRAMAFSGSSLRFYHAFCRPRDGELWPENFRRSFEALELILRHGMLCTPERFKLFPDPRTTLPVKMKLRTEKEPHDKVTQVRACFSLSDRSGLNLPYTIDRPSGRPRTTTHANEFGKFAIAIESGNARDMGLLPVVYYYDSSPCDPFGDNFQAGLSRMLVNRLDEVRNIMAILSHVEAIAHMGQGEDSGPCFLFRPALNRHGIIAKYENVINDLLEGLSARESQDVFRLFDTDRDPAWQVYDSIMLLLSSMQTADSTQDDSMYSFFRQREWRLIHCNMAHLTWFSLGRQPQYADPHRSLFESSRACIRSYISQSRGHLGLVTDESYLDQMWVLGMMHGRPFREYISEIITPNKSWSRRVKELCDELYPSGRLPRILEMTRTSCR